jgi:CheY-like chemotaxis protein
VSGFPYNHSDKIKTNSILIVDDNEGDRKLFELAFSELGTKNQIQGFSNGEEALKYLKNLKEIPFLILSDINMPTMNGIQLKKEIEKDIVLSLMSIPFIFFSSSASLYDIKEAFLQKAQGYFQKASSISILIDDLHSIIEYWNRSEIPSSH